MRIKAIAAALIAAFSIAPSGAQANCQIGEEEVACKTRNGHYRIKVPSGPGPHPAVLYLYGSGGNSRSLVEFDGFVQAFVDRGYAVIVPAGLNKRYVTGIGSGWFLRNSRAAKKRDDTRFVAEVIADAEIAHRIDPRRVLISGMSNGAFLAWEIACHSPDLGAAYAPIAGGYLGKMPSRCAKPVRIMHTHGRADQVVTIDESGDRISGGARIEPLASTMEKIAKSNGCISPAVPAKFKEYTRTSWDGCPINGSVDLLLHDGGHTIPLSWYSTIIDWFEQGSIVRPAPVAATAPATATRTTSTSETGSGNTRFQSATQQRGGRFQSSTNANRSRFKKAKTNETSDQ